MKVQNPQNLQDLIGDSQQNQQNDFANLLQQYSQGSQPDFQQLLNQHARTFEQPAAPEPSKFNNILNLLNEISLASLEHGVANNVGDAEAIPAGIAKALRARQVKKASEAEKAQQTKEKRYNDMLALAGGEREFGLRKDASELARERFGKEYGLEEKKHQLHEKQFGIDAQYKNSMNELHRAQANALKAEVGPTGKSNKETFATEEKLRKEYVNLNKSYDIIRDGFQRVQVSADEPSAAGDISLLFGFMKMLDPNSVVRESEYATAENAAGVPESVRRQFNSLKTGETLTPNMRKDFLNTADKLYRDQENKHRAISSQFSTLAKQYDVNPENVVIDFGARPGNIPISQPNNTQQQNIDPQRRLEEINRELMELGIPLE